MAHSAMEKADEIVDRIKQKLEVYTLKHHTGNNREKGVVESVDLDTITKEYMECGNLGSPFDPHLLSWPGYVNGKFAHGTIEDVIMSKDVIEKKKVWIPGLPVLDDKLAKFCAANLTLMTNVDMDAQKIENDVTILRDESAWVYCYISARDNRVTKLPKSTLDAVYTSQTVDVDMKPNNKIFVGGIPMPFWPPHKYISKNSKGDTTEKQNKLQPQQQTTLLE